ncbi:hypothetical protein FN846DRAFT_911832 [Sphaerosporella brunnea]|uniref:RNase H type-1 domain-containing protein n=1 Tax=Sphaerosporella brunnea TaxID=1250544 RepID=A0A5J5EI93_9PEZI|nr:hypothetical protein FN846DRAFT_911832 [Sphaerosporella brunnea]
MFNVHKGPKKSTAWIFILKYPGFDHFVHSEVAPSSPPRKSPNNRHAQAPIRHPDLERVARNLSEAPGARPGLAHIVGSRLPHGPACLLAALIIEPVEGALQAAKMWQQATDYAIALYTDDSRLECGTCGSSAVTITPSGDWAGKAKYLGNNKEAYDAELFGILAGLALVKRRQPAGAFGTVSIFPDSQAALRLLKLSTPGPRQSY